MSTRVEKLKEELKKRNDKRKSSPLEDWFVKCFNELGIYNYYREYQVEMSFLDFAWPDLKFAVEADGELYHFDRIEKDKERDKQLALLGWEIYRVNSKKAWNYKIFLSHLLYIYDKTQNKKIPSYSAIELLSKNNPSEFINNWHKELKEEKEKYMSENRIYYCDKCDYFYSKNINCKCK